MNEHPVRNAKAEASAVAGRPALVLEPSPPAVTTEPWFADDPADPTGHREAVVGPTTAAPSTWSELSTGDAVVADFASANWLGNFKPLPTVPAGYVSSRDDFHRLAYGVVSNARKAANGKIGLRYTLGGFGTPFFGDDEQVRVEGDLLVVQQGRQAKSTKLSTLAAAADFAHTVASSDQAEHDTVELGSLDRPLDVRAEVGLFLGDWFGFATAVLEELRLIGTESDDVARVQIWPGHFDAATELGSADLDQRATFGASPGDSAFDEPYLYVGAWGQIDKSEPFWNSESFNGGVLTYSELRSAADAKAAALEFFGRGYELLHR